MEAKASPLEVMTLPSSLQQDNTENYSGHGMDQEGEDARTTSGEEREMQGSGEGSNFAGQFGLKARNMDISVKQKSSLSQSQTEVVTVAEHTTLSQWQLVVQPTAPSQGFHQPDTAEEARGEMLFVQRPTAHLSSASSRRGEGSKLGSIPVFWKHNKDANVEEMVTSTPEVLMGTLTTSMVTTVDSLKTRYAQRTYPITTEKTSDRVQTEETSISISWVQEEKGEPTSTPDQQGHLSAALTPSGLSQTTLHGIEGTTFTSDSNIGATEMESRSAVSESFVVGGQWTPFKNMRPKTVEDKKTNNPFNMFIPKWAFGFIPSGM